MALGGFLLDGHKRNQQNRSLAKGQGGFKESLQTKGRYGGADVKLTFKKATPEEMAAFKARFSAYRKRERTKLLITTILVASAVVGLLFWILF